MNATTVPERDPLAPLNQAEQSDVVNDILRILRSEATTEIDQVSWTCEDNGIRVQTETFDYKGKNTHSNGKDKKRSTLVFSLLNGASADSQLVINVGDTSKQSAVLFRGDDEPVSLEDDVATYLSTYARRLVLGMADHSPRSMTQENSFSLARNVIVNTLGAGSEGYIRTLKEDLKTNQYIDAWSVRSRDLPSKLLARAILFKASTVTRSRIFYLTDEDGQRTEVKEEAVTTQGNSGNTTTSFDRYVKLSRYFKVASKGLTTVVECSDKLTIRGHKDKRSKAEKRTDLFFGLEGIEDLPELAKVEHEPDFKGRVAQHADLLKFEAATMKLAYIVKRQSSI